MTICESVVIFQVPVSYSHNFFVLLRCNCSVSLVLSMVHSLTIAYGFSRCYFVVRSSPHPCVSAPKSGNRRSFTLQLMIHSLRLRSFVIVTTLVAWSSSLSGIPSQDYIFPLVLPILHPKILWSFRGSTLSTSVLLHWLRWSDRRILHAQCCRPVFYYSTNRFLLLLGVVHKLLHCWSLQERILPKLSNKTFDFHIFFAL